MYHLIHMYYMTAPLICQQRFETPEKNPGKESGGFS